MQQMNSEFMISAASEPAQKSTLRFRHKSTAETGQSEHAPLLEHPTKSLASIDSIAPVSKNHARHTFPVDTPTATYEPLTRRILGSVTIKAACKNTPIDVRSLYKGLWLRSDEVQLSDCADGTRPFTALSLCNLDLNVALREDTKNGLLSVDFYDHKT